MNIKIDISLCRVCLKQSTGTNIFTGKIWEKFLFTTLVQVEKNDGLSEIICKRCLARLQIAYDFKQDAIAANHELRSFISNVNKQFQQVTGSTSGSSKSRKRPREDSLQQDESESYYDLEDDMQALIDDEQDEDEFKDFKDLDEDSSDENKKKIARDQLVEILGDNNAISIRKTEHAQSLVTIQDDTIDEPPENMELFIVEDNNESANITYECEQSPGELITDETDEPQYLEDDENDDLYDSPPSKRSAPKSLRSPSSNPENRCDVCNKSFSTRTNLTRHRITHDGRKPYVCKICGNAFTQNGSLKSHMFIHTGERPYQCKECGKAFTQSKSLVFHVRRHTGEKPFPCNFCGVKFRQKDGLKRHIAAKHSTNRSKSHVCEICGKVLLSKYSMNMHLNRHSAKEIAAAEMNHSHTQNVSSTDSTSEIDVKHEEVKIRELAADEFDEMYECEYCDQLFNSSDLLEHRESHAELHEDPTKYIDDSS